MKMEVARFIKAPFNNELHFVLKGRIVLLVCTALMNKTPILKHIY